MEKSYKVRVNQFPASIEATVRVLRVYGNVATVEAVEGHPFTNGTGDSIFRNDLRWYKVTKVWLFQLEPIQPEGGKVFIWGGEVYEYAPVHPPSGDMEDMPF